MSTEISPEMRLYSPEGERLYLTSQERKAFLKASEDEDRTYRLFCEVLHYTGCRPSEALELTPERILISEKAIVFRTLKKRKKDARGRKKLPEYRTVPVPKNLIDSLEFVFDLKKINRQKKNLKSPFWNMSRTTAYRAVKRVMKRAKITGKQATGKGIRHSFGLTMLSGPRPLPLHILAQLMGHSSTKTTEIYTQIVGAEKRQMVIDAWKN